MTSTRQVHELLYMTEEIYNELYTEKFMRWCMNRSTNPDNDFQKLLANASISKWYNHEFLKIETEFIETASPLFGKVSYKALRQMFEALSIDLYKKFPQPLIESARNLNINANAN